ncbi:MAG: hypothetical protein NC184_05420 [Roseburia sp.]|nr:hypothetical protein [Roseburia sp.]
MENSDNHRSKVPIRLSVMSELEPVVCDGFYSERDDGFVMEFDIGTDNYAIEHTAASTKLTTRGFLSYDIVFGNDVSRSRLVTPFGDVDVSVSDAERDVAFSDDGITVGLKYTLSSESVGELSRNVRVTARFLH